MVKVNFEVIGVNTERGVAYVKYWADGATVERFHSDIGPYEIIIDPICATMTQDELYNYIADRGVGIVEKQSLALQAEASGTTTLFENLIGTTLSGTGQ